MAIVTFDGKDYGVHDAVMNATRDYLSSGEEVEQVADDLVATRELLARLVNVLNGRGVLSNDETVMVLRGWVK